MHQEASHEFVRVEMSTAQAVVLATQIFDQTSSCVIIYISDYLYNGRSFTFATL